MRRSLRARLDRRAVGLEAGWEASRQQRRRWRAHAAMGMLIRDSFARMGVDPAAATALRIADGAAAALRAIPDSEKLWRADEEASAVDADRLPPRHLFLNPQFVHAVEEFGSGERSRPNLTFAPLVELLAWCVGCDSSADWSLGERG